MRDRPSGERTWRDSSSVQWGEPIFENSAVGIAVSEFDGRFLVANAAYQRMTGYTEAELREMTLLDLTEEADRPATRDHISQLGTGAVRQYQIEKRYRRKDRSLIWVRITASLLPAGPGSRGYVLVIAEDSRERKRVEEALRESEQRLRQLAEHVLEVLWMVDLKTHRTLYVNPAYERIWGRTCESLYRDTLSFIDAVHPEDRQRLLDAFEEQVRSHIPFDISYRVIRPDGSTLWIRDRSFPVRDDAGEVYRFVGIAEDITERKRVEENLRRSEAYLSKSERLVQTGSWGLKLPAREIVYWSQETYRIFGFDPGSGPPILEAVLARIHPEDRAALEPLNRMLGEKKEFELDCRILLPDGSVRYIHTVGNPVVNDAGELVEFNGITVDVTERKLTENALQRAMEHYRALAARLETVREEERMRLSREVHDELGQALTGIKMELKLLIPHPQGTKNSRAILKLIDNTMQSIRRIASELRPRILDDLGLVAAVEWAAEEFAARTGTKCAMDLPHADLAVDPEIATAIFRIFQEVLTNIARHAEATEFKVFLTHDNGGLRLEVRDNGKGFNEAQKVPGESLGILGMRERSLLLGGHLTIRSSPGEGATVTVWIPELRKGAAK